MVGNLCVSWGEGRKLSVEGKFEFPFLSPLKSKGRREVEETKMTNWKIDSPKFERLNGHRSLKL